MIAEVMTYESALLGGIVAMAGGMGIIWARLAATDKRQQKDFDDYKAMQERELAECKQFRAKFIEFLISWSNIQAEERIRARREQIPS